MCGVCLQLCVSVYHDCVCGVYSLKTSPGVCAHTHISRSVNLISATKEDGETGVRNGSASAAPVAGHSDEAVCSVEPVIG